MKKLVGKEREKAIEALFPEAERSASEIVESLSWEWMRTNPLPNGAKVFGIGGHRPTKQAYKSAWWTYYFHCEMNNLCREKGIRRI